MQASHGVNDVLALKDADCSVAMASGSEAASQVAQVVLLDNDFSKMPSVVLEGRRVVNNIQRSAGLFFVKNIFSFLLSILSLVFMFSYPLEPSQVSFITMFTIGIPGGIADVFAVGALVFFGKAFHLDNADISTAATLLLSIVGFMVLYKISQPMNTLRTIILIGNMISPIIDYPSWSGSRYSKGKLICMGCIVAISLLVVGLGIGFGGNLV